MNQYTKSVMEDLKQLNRTQIEEIKQAPLNGMALSRLQIDMDIVQEVCDYWNNSHLFYENEGTSEEKAHICYYSFVEDVILKYCQNRVAYKRKFHL